MKMILIGITGMMLSACSYGLPSHYDLDADRAAHNAYLGDVYAQEYIGDDCFVDDGDIVCEVH